MMDDDELEDLQFYAKCGKELLARLCKIGQDRDILVDTGDIMSYAIYVLIAMQADLETYESKQRTKWKRKR